MQRPRYFDLESVPRHHLIALEKLGRIERAVYVLHHVLRQSPREIASALDMTEHAVRGALQRAAARVDSVQWA